MCVVSGRVAGDLEGVTMFVNDVGVRNRARKDLKCDGLQHFSFSVRIELKLKLKKRQNMI